MNTPASAEEHYQRGYQYIHANQGDRQDNLQHAITCYELALQVYTDENVPGEREKVQEALADAYSELAQIRLQQTSAQPVIFHRSNRLTRPQILLLILIVVGIARIPTTVIANSYIARSGANCVQGSLNTDGSTALQPFVETAAEAYMQQCPGSAIAVGGGASKTGLSHVEQGQGKITGVRQKAFEKLNGTQVPIGIGSSDIFASPDQSNLVDHQVAVGVFVVILNGQVTGLHNLTTPQIQGIYTGVYHNWKDICEESRCGPDKPIIPITRTLNSGTRFTFEKYILKGVATVPGTGLDRVLSSSDAVTEVEMTPYSIGYAPLYQASMAHNVTIVSIDNQDPHDRSLIKNNTYHFWNIEHIYTHTRPDALTQSFINYINSPTSGPLRSQCNLLSLNDIPKEIRNRHILELQ